MFSTPPQNIAVLRQRIIDEVNPLRQQSDVIRNAMRDMQRRLPYFVLREMGDTLKDKALDNLIVVTCKINKKRFSVTDIILLAPAHKLNKKRKSF